MHLALRLMPFAALAFAALPAQAALPPWHQRAAELRAVLNQPGLVAAFGTDMIERIEYAGPDLYRVSAGRCHVDARIHSLPMPRGMVGGRRFEVRLGRKICR